MATRVSCPETNDWTATVRLGSTCPLAVTTYGSGAGLVVVTDTVGTGRCGLGGSLHAAAASPRSATAGA